MIPIFFCPDKTQLKDNISEIKRYLGYPKSADLDKKTQELILQTLQQTKELITPKSVFQTFELSIQNQTINFANHSFFSKDLSVNLKNCTKVTLLACTIGTRFDIFLKRAQLQNPPQAAILQACGAMYVEELVKETNHQIEKLAQEENCQLRPRFSPGFGDVYLETQKIFFDLLPCNKIGLSLMDTLIMSPEKSVTAFIGWQEK